MSSVYSQCHLGLNSKDTDMELHLLNLHTTATARLLQHHSMEAINRYAHDTGAACSSRADALLDTTTTAAEWIWIWRTKWSSTTPRLPSQTWYVMRSLDVESILTSREEYPTSNSNAYTHGNYGAPAPPPTQAQTFGNGSPSNYTFQYSNCTGRRKALLIGINYFGQRGQLRGCINDVKNMSTYLNEHFGYKREDMVILTDDQQNPMSQPTKANILRAMHWLVKDARPNDSLFFHYSGRHSLCSSFISSVD